MTVLTDSSTSVTLAPLMSESGSSLFYFCSICWVEIYSVKKSLIAFTPRSAVTSLGTCNGVFSTTSYFKLESCTIWLGSSVILEWAIPKTVRAFKFLTWKGSSRRGFMFKRSS